MKPLTARWVYCVGLFVLTACAVLPEAKPVPVAAVSTAVPMTTEIRLAHAIRERIELQQVYTASHPSMAKATATETALRQLAFSGDRVAARSGLISALAHELSDALADRTELSVRYAPKHPEMQKAEAAVKGLTAAINMEVHQNRV